MERTSGSETKSRIVVLIKEWSATVIPLANCIMNRNLQECQNAVKKGLLRTRHRLCLFPGSLSPVRPLRVIKVPAAAERSIELNDREPPIPRSLRQTDFGRVKELLGFQYL